MKNHSGSALLKIDIKKAYDYFLDLYSKSFIENEFPEKFIG